MRRVCWEQAKPEHDQGRPCLIGQPWSRTEGKPAVRNLREERANVGIIRSPLRASLLPDQAGMNVRHRVELSQAERDQLTGLLNGGKHSARKLKRARLTTRAVKVTDVQPTMAAV